ncbi:hypothetical protein acsn021_29260 [Anaerocolumna cellulosilytica]|uniref:Uncharacterized protein n=1 Tax=Anaerocolumna cellulosilytica TaxID=433286 RepID=A0A6S6R5H7_9FIRM|nr:radical SAM protein [Anaerocolumna cellulosilytica]MBB5197144.1 radical SAM protein with 4Fe4S-binding SPASM domain [Anaerocolumna cellulosilytica]BCJ95357.1 hypothetical protein acsn021_29260 [Anaerocolumna cellulosilytica]
MERTMECNIIEWNKDVSFLKYKNRVIIGNRFNGKWLKISKECFDILEKIIDLKLDSRELFDVFEDKEDCDYFRILIDKLEEAKCFKERNEEQEHEIEYIYFALTNRCNLNCIHCSVDASSRLREEYLDTNEIISIIDKIIKVNAKAIIFTGGEPLIRNDFFAILEYTRKHFSGKIILMTNATLINENNVSELAQNLDSIDISLDGVNEETCSRIRGKGVFNKVVSAIKLLQQNGLTEISVSMVLSKINEPLLDDFYNLNKNLGTTPVPRVFAELGRGKESKDEFIPQSELSSYAGIKTKEEYDKDKRELYDTLKVCDCRACKTNYTINYDGNLYPCGLLINDKYKLANMRDMRDFNSVLEFSDKQAILNVENIQPDNYEKCKDCEINIFCWSCIESIDQLDGTEEFTNRCNRIKNYLIETIWESEY